MDVLCRKKSTIVLFIHLPTLDELIGLTAAPGFGGLTPRRSREQRSRRANGTPLADHSSELKPTPESQGRQNESGFAATCEGAVAC
ncbi:hypothetical protein [Amycolatopsis sp. NPDC004079]|uniref:hypothetical protein n=1 Tax=Amycolatopsis sp. NPDC004079 TaxID=3154549 RepID=UPI0033B9168B